LDLAVVATAFGVIFLAELPDKTALASLVLGTRYRSGYVFVGVAAAFTVHVVLAIVAGSLLGLAPHRVVEVIVAVLFAAGAVVMLRKHDDMEQSARSRSARARDGSPAHETAPAADSTPARDGSPAHESAPAGRAGSRRPAPGHQAAAATASDGFWRVVGTSFMVVFVAEFGDLTQIAIANLAARYHQPFSVGAGSVAAMWAVAALAIVGGRQLLRLLPFTWIIRAAAAVMAVLAVLSLLDAITG
jgi:putative Ca2+/H+ antiporter (TMEM165/GDT1 family)